jgi:hypothetical protein
MRGYAFLKVAFPPRGPITRASAVPEVPAKEQADAQLRKEAPYDTYLAQHKKKTAAVAATLTTFSRAQSIPNGELFNNDMLLLLRSVLAGSNWWISEDT